MSKIVSMMDVLTVEVESDRNLSAYNSMYLLLTVRYYCTLGRTKTNLSFLNFQRLLKIEQENRIMGKPSFSATTLNLFVPGLCLPLTKESSSKLHT